MAVIPHPMYSTDLAPCDLLLFPKMKLKLKGRRFDTIEEIQAESQRMLDTDRNGLPGSVPRGDGGTGIYMREGTTSRVMTAYRPHGEFFIFIFTASVRNIVDTNTYIRTIVTGAFVK
jgi:hypothetical protein